MKMMSIAVGIEIVKIFPFFLSKLESEYWCLSAESHGQIQEDVKIWVELGEGNTCNEPREIFEMTQHPNGLHSAHTEYTQNTQHPIYSKHTAPNWTKYTQITHSTQMNWILGGGVVLCAKCSMFNSQEKCMSSGRRSSCAMCKLCKVSREVYVKRRGGGGAVVLTSAPGVC